MINIALTVIAFSLLYTILHKLAIIYSQSKCFEPSRIRDYVEGRINKKSAEYDQIIGHLGICEHCQQLVDDVFNGKGLEDHLIDKEEGE